MGEKRKGNYRFRSEAKTITRDNRPVQTTVYKKTWDVKAKADLAAAISPKPDLSVVEKQARAQQLAEQEYEQAQEPTWFERLRDRYNAWRYRDELKAEDRAFLAMVVKLEADAPAEFPTKTAEDYEREYEAGKHFMLRRDMRIARGLDPDTGIDKLGIDEFGRTAEQRQLTVDLKNLPTNSMTGEKWDVAGFTAVDTWRDTGRKLHPKHKHNPAHWKLEGSDYIYLPNGTVFDDHGRTFDGKSEDEYAIEVLVPRYSKERAESDQEAIELRLRMDAGERDERFTTSSTK